MFRTHKILSLALVSLAFVSPGCDEDVDLESDEQEMQAAIDDEDLSAARPDAEPAEASEDISEDAPDDLVIEPQTTAAKCQGWPKGDWCLARCSSGELLVMGHKTQIDYGQCTNVGINFCGLQGLEHACWGHP